MVSRCKPGGNFQQLLPPCSHIISIHRGILSPLATDQVLQPIFFQNSVYLMLLHRDKPHQWIPCSHFSVPAAAAMGSVSWQLSSCPVRPGAMTGTRSANLVWLREWGRQSQKTEPPWPGRTAVIISRDVTSVTEVSTLCLFLCPCPAPREKVKVAFCSVTLFQERFLHMSNHALTATPNQAQPSSEQAPARIIRLSKKWSVSGQ